MLYSKRLPTPNSDYLVFNFLKLRNLTNDGSCILNSTNIIQYNFLIESSIICRKNYSGVRCEKRCVISPLSSTETRIYKELNTSGFFMRYLPTSYLKLVNLILITVVVAYLFFSALRVSSEPIRKTSFYSSVISGLNGNPLCIDKTIAWNGFFPSQTASFLATNAQINPIGKEKKDDYYDQMTNNDIFIDDLGVYEVCDAAKVLENSHANSLMHSRQTNDDYNIYSNESTDVEYYET
ncbi:hypothetical protein RF11_08497 [Thelohanellus kitauei]|uniref:Uncharacterized protein n=1 Tax=Thelohanellus kitauei TaxID=669202 RepID=A0A0C2J253_THEKT|nr:hypothetical protein RF11_08497 [Thelohanellus kitauei]